MSWLLPSLLPPLLRSPRPAKVGRASDQIRSVKTALRSSYVLFFAEPCRLGSVKLVFTEPCSCRDRFVFSFFFVFICFAISVSHHSHPETNRFVSKHTRNTHGFSNSPTVRRTPYSMRPPVFRALPSGTNHRAASRLHSVSSLLRGLNDACVGRRLVDLCF